MRNPVSRHDFNRASTHVDRSKEPQLTIEDGLDDYHEGQVDCPICAEEDAYREEFCRELQGRLDKELFTIINSTPPK